MTNAEKSCAVCLKIRTFLKSWMFVWLNWLRIYIAKKNQFKTLKENPVPFVIYSLCNKTVEENMVFFFLSFLLPHASEKLMV